MVNLEFQSINQLKGVNNGKNRSNYCRRIAYWVFLLNANHWIMGLKMTQIEAFTQALVLAIVAPSDEQSKKAISLAIELSSGLPAEIINQCKDNALSIVREK